MYLGLDCGTSGLKALLTDEDGEPVASAARAYSPTRPRAGWSEQNPDDWANAMAGAIADLGNVAGKPRKTFAHNSRRRGRHCT